MNYKDFNIDISYKNIGEERFCDIINPLLSCTETYQRSVGFFSSKALTFIKTGILELARNGGTIQLATSPKLSEDDIRAIADGYDAREIIEQRTLSEFESSLSELDDANLSILYSLIKERILDIRIIVKDKGMYHDKLAVLTDRNGNRIACVGSNNESSGGYNDNYEKVRIYRSWIEPDRVIDEIEEFESIWDGTNSFLHVYKFSDAKNKELLECIERTKNSKKNQKKKVELRPYQTEAKNAWIANGYKGFFEMATGTGKTLTALFSIMELIKSKPVFTVILAPYKHLVNQWYDTIKENFDDVEVIKVYGEIKDAEQLIYAKYIQSKKNYRPIIVVSTIVSFFIDRYQTLYDLIGYERLLVVDEAHNFINKISDELSAKYKYKLGLSATPVFGKDAGKTTLLLEWFGGRVMSFPIEKAIGKYLVNYEYIPFYIDATDEDEDKFKKATQIMLSCIDSSTGKIVDEERFNVAYRSRLRAISMADEKIERIQEIFNTITETNHTIIYCSDGRLFRSGKQHNEESEIKHLDYILELINDSVVKKSLKASRFTATEDASTRMKLIDLFNAGKIDYLVAIKCLDEGIDIPSIKSALILSSNDNYREFVQRRGRILRKYSGKDIAKIYDVIVLPSYQAKGMAEIELRRFYEYAKLAYNKDQLLPDLESIMKKYDLAYDDIQFKNEYIYGGDLDE